MQEITLIYGIFGAVLGAALISLIRNRTLAMLANILASASALIMSLVLFSFGNVENAWLFIDTPAKVMLAVISMTYLFASLQASVSLSAVREFAYRPNYAWALLAGFALSMLLAVSTPSLSYAWLWLETSTIISAALILVESEKKNVESAWRYLLIASSGLAIALLSVIIFGRLSGTEAWMGASVSHGAVLVGSLALIGFGTKAGLFPMHTWLPDAHGTAPAPVSAMLSGALLPSALMVFYRVYTVLHSSFMFYLTAGVGVLTVWVASLLMLSQRKTKRLFAYSSMDVMGIATVGIALTYYEPNAINFVLLIFVAHALAKSALFLAAGTLKAHGMDSIASAEGLMARSKSLSFAVITSSLAVTGAPPFAMFFGEFGLFIYLAEHPYIFLLLILGILMSFLALNYHAVRMVFAAGSDNEKIALSEAAVPLGISIAAILIVPYLYWIWGCLL